MKAYRIGVLFASIAAVAAAIVCRPRWLAENEFLQGFVTSEIIAVLIVILTITFGSVANIQLALNRIEASMRPHRREGIHGIRKDVNSDAWIIFWAFLVCVCALLVKGAFGGNVHIVAAANGVGIIVLLLNALVLHTIYRAIFALVTVENLLGNGYKDTLGKRQDYTDESPPTGSA